MIHWLICRTEIKNYMNRIVWTFFIGTIVALTLLILPLTADRMIAQAQNATLIQNPNNTRTILNMKDHIALLVNATTNETISVSNFTGNMGNTTTNENLTGNTTTNENLTGNTTTNENLTAKFKSLQGN
jgi:hypothetical protein